ncbi:MAG: lipoprotein-releasing ABC transporter permease subunit [Rickettsiales bacterium]|jgi:lipoprotein-releasing system permease protein|nr:lipoprotein-releasing ABC transporter permease subunit [Rickettsiales bacterium]
MFTKLERKVAFRYMRTRKRGFGSVISWVSLVGIMLGVATLVVVMSVMSGFHHVLLSRIVGMNGHIVIYHQDGAIRDFDYLIRKISEDKRVSGAATGIVPVVEGQVMASFNGRNSGAMVRGIRMSDLSKKVDAGTKIYGSALAKIAGGDVVMGATLARSLRLTLGDSATLVSANGGTPTAFGMMPRIMSYKVASTFFMGMHEYDSGFVFMPLDAAQKYLNIGNAATHVDIFLRNPNDTDSIKRIVADNLPNGFVVRDWRELNRGFVGALQVESNVMFLILLLIVIVAAFNIVSSLVMLVKDKSRDIAVFRTFGVPRKSIMKIFILSGTSIGIVGALVGAGLGVLIASYVEQIRQFFQWATGRDLFPAEMYYLSELPSEINVASVVGIALVAILLAFLATLYPAWKAGKTDPVEVLRYE